DHALAVSTMLTHWITDRAENERAERSGLPAPRVVLVSRGSVQRVRRAGKLLLSDAGGDVHVHELAGACELLEQVREGALEVKLAGGWFGGQRFLSSHSYARPHLDRPPGDRAQC